MTTNAFESFNYVLKGSRGLPIQALIAGMFFRLVRFFRSRRENTEKWSTPLTLTNEKCLKFRKRMGSLHSKQRFSRTEWEVANREGYTCAIKLTDNDSTCTCNIPQLKLPREHVIATCAKEKGCVNISMYSLCAWWYIVENYPKTYVGLFHPIPDPRTWVEYNRLWFFHLNSEGRRVAPFYSHTHHHGWKARRS